MDSKLKVYPHRVAICEYSPSHNATITMILTEKPGDDANTKSFSSAAWNEVRIAAITDLELRIDNFRRSPVPPMPFTGAIVLHVPERNAVKITDISVEPYHYELSGEQWRCVCLEANARLVNQLDELTAQHKLKKEGKYGAS